MSLVTSTPSDTAPAPMASARQPSSAHSDALRYGWILPRRRGAYLTGTAGPNRLGGLDAARGLALLGMMAAHVGFTTCGLTSLSGVLDQAHGRSAVLFAVIAGFSLGIMSGRTKPHTGEALVRTRLRILARSALLLVLAAGLDFLGPPVGAILGYYAAWLALALPFLRWRPRNLFLLAAGVAVAGPFIRLGLPEVLNLVGMSAYPSLPDGNMALISFFITGLYPGAVWMAYIFLGLGLSRLDWSRPRNLWRLAAVGALCAVVGYGAGWAASHAAGNAEPDAYNLVSPADPEQCVSLSAPGITPVGGRQEPTKHSGATADSTAPAPGSAPDGGVKGNGAKAGKKGIPGQPTPFRLSALATAGPHTDTTFEAVGSGGAAMLVIALLQLVSRRSRWLLTPLAAIGSMSLTVYCGHIVAIWALGTWSTALEPENNVVWAVMGGGFIVFAMAWFAVWARGPLEHLVHVVSMRTTRAND